MTLAPDSKATKGVGRGGNPPPPGRKFKPGQSGNPGGVPKWVHAARALCGAHAQEAIETLLSIMRDPDSQYRIQAANSILDRAGVKPYTVIEDETNRKRVIVSIDLGESEG